MKTNSNLHRILPATLLAGIALTAPAQDTLRPRKVITNAQMVAAGAVNQLDTYLSPEEYTGSEVRYVSQSVRENGTRLSRELIHQARLAYTHNRADNNNEIGGGYNFQYNVHWKAGSWQVGNGLLSVKVGAGVDANVGFLYNTRNSNNPAQAYLSLNLAPSAVVGYWFRLWNRPFQLRYAVQAPLAGLMFSPNYGQSYYEIFSEGNYDHNIVPTTFASTPSLRQLLSLDLTLRHTTLRLGYLGDFQQSKANHLKTHTWSNLLVVGIVRTFSINKILP